MAGKVKVSGTNYDIKSGKVKVSGTNYTIKGGKVKVNGTNYTIDLGGSKTLTISGCDTTYFSAYVVDAADPYTLLEDGTYEFEEDDVFIIGVYGQSSYTQYCRVYLNNTLVKSGACEYELSASSYSSIKIEFKPQNYNTYYWCYITAT